MLARMMAHSPIRNSYRITLWANFFAGPIFADMEKQFGLLRDEFNILGCLHEYGPLAAKHVCALTGRPKNSISRAVSRLTARDIVDRQSDSRDRRQSVLRIKPEGRRLYKQILPRFVAREAIMLSALSSEERGQLDLLLGKLMAVHAEWSESY